MRLTVSALISGAMVAPLSAAEVTVTIEVPRLTVAEYHRPYVAIWLESAEQAAVANLAVWYDVKMRNNEGIKWLKDLRQWWRRSGRELTMPVDGLSSATRAPGEHRVSFPADKGTLASLKPGQYQLVIEAAREVGGRELLRLPVQWPPTAPQTQKAKGEHELGAVAVEITP